MELNDMILVSVDDHIVEPGDMFQQHMTAKELETAPKLIKSPEGVEYWTFEDKVLPNIGLNAVVGRVPEEYGCEPTSFDHMRKGCWDVRARVDDMNANGMLGSLCFGTFPGFEGSLFIGAKDKANANRIIQAYNDWHIDEWCGSYPGRFIPTAILPLWDPALMVEEIKRVKAKGCHNISFSDNPAAKGLPSIHNECWEPFWQACVEYDMTISCHIGSGNQPVHPSMESPIEVWTMVFPLAIAISAADWLHLDALKRYPDLRIALSEGGIGWVPYLLERSEYVHEQHKAWTRSDFGMLSGRELFLKHFHLCFIEDIFGMKLLDELDIDKVMYECDYPHSDTQWPNAPDRLLQTMSHLSDEVIDKITHLNAMRTYNYDPFSVLPREQCTVGALRAQAEHVDLTPLSFGNSQLLGDTSRPVTSGDIAKLFTDPAAA